MKSAVATMLLFHFLTPAFAASNCQLPQSCINVFNSLSKPAGLGTLQAPSQGTYKAAGTSISEEAPDGLELYTLSKEANAVVLSPKKTMRRWVAANILHDSCRVREISLEESSRVVVNHYWSAADVQDPYKTVTAKLVLRFTGNDCLIANASYSGTIVNAVSCGRMGLPECPSWSASASNVETFEGNVCLDSSAPPMAEIKKLYEVVDFLLNNKPGLRGQTHF